MKSLFCAFIILISFNGLAQSSQKPDADLSFRKSMYPEDKYVIKYDTAGFLDLSIALTHVMLRMDKQDESSEFACRAWLHIFKKGKKSSGKYYNSIEALGSCSGLFLPESQPRKDVFVLSKFGDYDGEIIIIDSTGKVQQFIGGDFYLSADNRYLFSNYYSDLSGFTVYDLNQKKLLFTGELEARPTDWYFQDNQFFSIAYDEGTAGDKVPVILFDLKTTKPIITTLNRNNIKRESRLKKFDVPDNCNCGK